MRDLQTLRGELDQLDTQIVELFEKRMDICREVAAYKIANGMAVLDASRESQVLDSRAAKAQDQHYAPAVRELFTCLMALSRAEQQRMMEEEN